MGGPKVGGGTPGAPAEPGAHCGRASEGPTADADPAAPRHQRDANREPHWAEDTMKPMIVTVAGKPRMRSSDGGRAHGDTREAEPPAQVPSWPKSDTGAWKHQGGRANGTTSTKAGTASVANGRTNLVSRCLQGRGPLNQPARGTRTRLHSKDRAHPFQMMDGAAHPHGNGRKERESARSLLRGSTTARLRGSRSRRLHEGSGGL